MAEKRRPGGRRFSKTPTIHGTAVRKNRSWEQDVVAHDLIPGHGHAGAFLLVLMENLLIH